MDDCDKRIETRISLVLYGGVSLAVYMSGACQELLSLVRASSGTIDRNDLSPVEQEYWDLSRSGGTDGHPRRVVVDVLAGSSAGGLNALFLAKALAHGGNLDSLRQIWYDQADLLHLMGLDDENPSTTGSQKALLDSGRFHAMIHDALKGISDQANLDEDQRLVDDVDCYVTTTDLRGVAETVRLDTSDPSETMRIQELRRRAVFHFADRRRQKCAAETKTQLDSDHDAVLAFAGRSTAAHPAAFYPAQWNEVEGQRDDACNRAPELGDFLSPRLHPEGGLLDLQDRWYTDGGVMDNKPFKYALEPLGSRRAEVPVDRKVIFIEPDPVSQLDDWHETDPPPLWNYTGGTYGLARAENIREDIAELAARNESIASLNSGLVGLFARSETEVRAALEARLSDRYLTTPINDDKLVEIALGDGYEGAAVGSAEGGVVDKWVNQARADFGKERGWGAVALEEYRWRAMVSQLVQSALTVGESLADQALVAALSGPVEQRLRDWMIQSEPDNQPVPNPERKGLKLLDVEYRLRRFTLIEHLLSYEQQKILSRSGGGAGQSDRFGQCVRLRRTINGLYADLNNYLEDRRSELIVDHRNMSEADLRLFIDSGEMFAQIEKTVDDLDGPLQRASRDGRAAILNAGLDTDLLLLAADAWVNYGDYDQLILPLADTAASKFGAIDAIRISPLDAPGLVDERRPDWPRRKLGGNALAHFGGFIDADWRLNDITWGRFDTAEVLVRQVLNGNADDVRAVHDAMLTELANESRPSQTSSDEADSLPLEALLKVDANGVSKLHGAARRALDDLRACEPGTEEEDAAAAEVVEAFGLLLRGPATPPTPAPRTGAAAQPDEPWSVDLSANAARKDTKKLVLNEGAALLGKAVALSDDQRRPTRVVAGWLLSGSLRLTLPKTDGEMVARHLLPVLLTVAGLGLLVLSVLRHAGAAALTVGALGATAFAVYARARAFGARHNGALWQKLGVGSFVASPIALAVAFGISEGSAGVGMLAVVLTTVGIVMWLSLRTLERVVQAAGHPKPIARPDRAGS